MSGPQRFVGSRPTKKQRPTLISGKVPPDWCTVAIPMSLAARGPEKAPALPSISTVPEVGLCTPESVLISVDLPAPLSPSRQSTSPACTFSEMSCSTSIGPKDLLTPLSSRIGAAITAFPSWGCR